MKAMIFAAGLGTRLKPLTDTMPKALVPVGGKPLLEILIRKLKASGFDEVVINVHHFADQIIRFVNENEGFGLNIRISDETACLLETGGAIKKAVPLLNGNRQNEEPFMIHNVDILSNLDFGTFMNCQSADSERAATLLVNKRETSRQLLFDKENRLVGITERPMRSRRLIVVWICSRAGNWLFRVFIFFRPGFSLILLIGLTVFP